jgi:hypothetical protein
VTRREQEKGRKEFFRLGIRSLSESLDVFYLEKDAEQRFEARAKAATREIKTGNRQTRKAR